MGVRSSLGGFAQFGLVLLALAAVTGCGDTTPVQLTSPGVARSVPNPASDTVRTTAAPKGTPAVGDTVPVGEGGTVTVSATEAHVNAGRLFPAGKGMDFYAAQVKACAGPGEQHLGFRPQYFTLEMADKTVRDAGLGVKKPDLRGGELPAGDCLDGWVTFVVPDKSQPAFVVYDGSEQLKWAIPAASPRKAGR